MENQKDDLLHPSYELYLAMKKDKRLIRFP